MIYPAAMRKSPKSNPNPTTLTPSQKPLSQTQKKPTPVPAKQMLMTRNPMPKNPKLTTPNLQMTRNLQPTPTPTPTLAPRPRLLLRAMTMTPRTVSRSFRSARRQLKCCSQSTPATS